MYQTIINTKSSKTIKKVYFRNNSNNLNCSADFRNENSPTKFKVNPNNILKFHLNEDISINEMSHALFNFKIRWDTLLFYIIFLSSNRWLTYFMVGILLMGSGKITLTPHLPQKKIGKITIKTTKILKQNKNKF